MLMIKKVLSKNALILALLFFVYTANAQSSKSYITNHKTMATLLSEHYGIPASVILAVAFVESSAGRGATAKVLNNHFGIEGHNNIVNSRGHKSRYKQYSNEIASYIDFCRLVTHKRYYKRLKDTNDATAWVRAISHAGYSEQPELWEKRILSTIKTNRL